MSEAAVLAAVSGARPNMQGWLRGRCPLCPIERGKADKGSSLAVRPETGAYVCFACGARGHVEPLLVGAEAEAAADASEILPNLGAPEGYVPLWEADAQRSFALAPAREMLAARLGGVRLDLWQRAALGACVTGWLAGRVIIPLADRPGVWAGWVGRDWTGRASMNYRYCPGMSRGDYLYNGAILAEETDVPAIVVEGSLDVLACGLVDSCATLGALGNNQYALLKESKRPVCLVPDGDAWRNGWTTMVRLRLDGVRVGMVRLGPRVDPDEVDLDELRRAARLSIDNDMVELES